VRARNPSNAAFLHPQDLAALGVTAGDTIEIASQRGRIQAIARADETMRLGVISMAHCWGGLPDSGSLDGDNINLLIDSTSDVEAVNAMPRMSAIPVQLRRASREA
jgi:anaerobic selenocysteine-containing dehydrogenase